MRGWLRRRRKESGQALVEFALVLPLIVFAIIDFGRIYQANVTLTNAAREGARLGTVGGTTSQIQARVKSTASGLSPTTSVTNAQGTAGTSVVVSASATVSFITPV